MRWSGLHLTFIGLCCAVSVFAQPADGVPARDPVSRTLRLPPQPPLPQQDPVGYFRTLLAMSPADREDALRGRSEEGKRVIQAKLKEYESLTPENRELRLRLTELRFHLVPLMKERPENREAALALIPERDRPLIEERLRRWDQIPPELRAEFLENENVVHYFLRMQSTTPEQQAVMLEDFPVHRREKLERDLERWRSLPADQRQRMCDQFQQFFELDDRERDRTLGALSDVERRQMEQTLATFEKLPAAQRRHCIESFRRFASMTPVERNQFLKNVERWEAMTPEEREGWRNLVRKVPRVPPLPPGMVVEPPLPPSVPPGGHGARP